MSDARLASAGAVDAALRELYGAELAGQRGVVHVAAVWAEAPGRYLTLAVNEHTPWSPRDQLVLDAARARAEAILVTGRILRDEPTLRYDPRGPWAAGLAAWRRDRLGLRSPPLLLVLSAGRDLPLAHPVFRGPLEVLLYTTRASAAALAAHPAAAANGRVRLVGVDRPDVHGAIEYLREAHGCRTVLVEAGPSTARALYAPPPRVDELLLSVFHGAALPPRARGPAFVSAADIHRALPRSWPAAPVEEPSGTWRFHRFTRG